MACSCKKRKLVENNFSLFTLPGKRQVFNPGFLTEQQRSLKYISPPTPSPHTKTVFKVLLFYLCYLINCVL